MVALAPAARPLTDDIAYDMISYNYKGTAMLTIEQEQALKDRAAGPTCVFSGDVYVRNALGVYAIDPDGNIRTGEGWPSRGVTLNEMRASDRAVAAVTGNWSRA